MYILGAIGTSNHVIFWYGAVNFEANVAELATLPQPIAWYAERGGVTDLVELILFKLKTRRIKLIVRTDILACNIDKKTLVITNVIFTQQYTYTI